MRHELHVLLALSTCTYLRPEDKCRYFLEQFPHHSDLLGFDWINKVRLSTYKRRVINQAIEQLDLEATLHQLNQQNIQFVTILETTYPASLRPIYAPPLMLYYKGDIALTSHHILGVVGPRQHSQYAIAAMNKLIPNIIKHKVVVVSGLAKGVDTLAHKHTISENGSTIAVIGTGINQHYPSSNKLLQQYIAKNHLLISEYPPHIHARKHHFPDRNRIIAGLSRGVLVVEAKERSGSLITGNRALEEGRDVFSVPGDITSSYSAGTNQLIKLGAIPVTDVQDIFSVWNYPK